MEQQAAMTWRVIGHSVTGASHRRALRDNQDRFGWEPRGPAASPWAVVAVADGHGGGRYSRSDRGARFAVQAAIEQARTLRRNQMLTTNLAFAKRAVKDPDRLAREIVLHWRELVREDVQSDPLADEEQPEIAYGTTLILVIITPRFIAYVQVGDGDIINVSDEGEVSRPLLPDPRQIGNETVSLCSPHAWNEARSEFRALSGRPPALVLVATDGYANSFASEEEFRQVGPDLLEMLRADGVEAVERDLPDWLRETSEQGSGDDVTLAVLFRADALQRITGGSMVAEDRAGAAALPEPDSSALSDVMKGQPSRQGETESVA